MKKLIMILFFLPVVSFAQSNYTYSYDEAGNRIYRMLVFLKKAEPQAVKVADYTVNIYPNPADRIVRIEIDGLSKNTKVKVEMFNITGAKVYYNESTVASQEIDLSELPSGAYFLNVYIGNKRSFWKIIKEK